MYVKKKLSSFNCVYSFKSHQLDFYHLGGKQVDESLDRKGHWSCKAGTDNQIHSIIILLERAELMINFKWLNVFFKGKTIVYRNLKTRKNEAILTGNAEPFALFPLLVLLCDYRYICLCMLTCEKNCAHYTLLP